MASPRTYPSIPDPIDENTLLPTVRALKQAVEILTGQRGNTPAATVYNATTTPMEPGVGDLWVRSTDQRMYTWNGLQWIPITT